MLSQKDSEARVTLRCGCYPILYLHDRDSHNHLGRRIVGKYRWIDILERRIVLIAGVLVLQIKHGLRMVGRFLLFDTVLDIDKLL